MARPDIHKLALNIGSNGLKLALSLKVGSVIYPGEWLQSEPHGPSSLLPLTSYSRHCTSGQEYGVPGGGGWDPVCIDGTGPV